MIVRSLFPPATPQLRRLAEAGFVSRFFKNSPLFPFPARRFRGLCRGLTWLLLGFWGVTAAVFSARATSSVTVAWNPGSGNVSGYHVYYGPASRNYTNLVSVGNVTNATISGLVSGATYYFAATALTSAGLESPDSNEASCTVGTNAPPPPPPPGLPAPWQTADIGSVSVPGSASVSNGLYAVQGAGNLSGTADNFRFLYQNLSGDGELRQQIKSTQDATSGGFLGAMIRESLTAGSRYAFMGLSTGGAFRWQRRSNTSGSTASTKAGSATLPKAWTRLVRTGNNLSGYKSTDGVNWTLVSSNTIKMATSIYIGLAVASGNASTLDTSVFTNLTVVP